jgi:hypothetical protein
VIISIANAAVLLLMGYAALGLLIGIPFVFRGVNRLDPAATDGSWGFRLVILPGVVALWPLLLRRWIAGTQAPVERNAHRLAAASAPTDPTR